MNARAAARAELSGVERVARELASRLPRLRPGRYRVARPPAPLAFRAGHVWEQAALPLHARRARLIYSPANLAPLASDKNVVLLHDVAPLRHPEWYSAAYARYQRLVLPLIARRARRVITVSRFSRAEILDCVGLPPERVSVVPNGVDDRFSPDADPGPARRAHRLERPYVLVVGSRIARKNLRALRSAQSRLAAAGIDLVAAGSTRAHLRAEPEPPARALGYVSDDQLPGLYAGASALAMPSLYEGFGLPCLEAMACGTPVVAADRGGLPETCGGAALLVEPDDQEAFAAALLQAAADGALRARLREAGLARAASLSWERAARLTDAVVDELLAGG